MGLQAVGAFVLVIGGLVFVHEAGHFVVAKLLGVKVLRFSIGFGPRLLWWTRGETEYRISALPLGGYVKMAGDDPSEALAPEDRGRGFLEQAPWKRLAIAVAGPAANFVTAFVLLVIVGLIGVSYPDYPNVVGALPDSSVAFRTGIREGDLIVAVGGAPEPD